MGGDNFANFKITEAIGENKIKIIPEFLIVGGNGEANPMSGLLGLELLKKFQGQNQDNSVKTIEVKEEVKEEPKKK